MLVINKLQSAKQKHEHKCTKKLVVQDYRKSMERIFEKSDTVTIPHVGEDSIINEQDKHQDSAMRTLEECKTLYQNQTSKVSRNPMVNESDYSVQQLEAVDQELQYPMMMMVNAGCGTE